MSFFFLSRMWNLHYYMLCYLDHHTNLDCYIHITAVVPSSCVFVTFLKCWSEHFIQSTAVDCLYFAFHAKGRWLVLVFISLIHLCVICLSRGTWPNGLIHWLTHGFPGSCRVWVMLKSQSGSAEEMFKWCKGE